MPLPVESLPVVFQKSRFTLRSSLCAKAIPGIIAFMRAQAALAGYLIRESDGLVSDAMAKDLKAVDCTGGGIDYSLCLDPAYAAAHADICESCNNPAYATAHPDICDQGLCPTVTLLASVTATNTALTVTWSSPQIGTGWTYVVESWDGAAWNSAVTATTITGTSFSYAATGLTNGTEYRYRARVTKTGCTAQAWAEAAGTPQNCALSGVTVTAVLDEAETAAMTHDVTVTGLPAGLSYTIWREGFESSRETVATGTTDGGDVTAVSSKVIGGAFLAVYNPGLPPPATGYSAYYYRRATFGITVALAGCGNVESSVVVTSLPAVDAITLVHVRRLGFGSAAFDFNHVNAAYLSGAGYVGIAYTTCNPLTPVRFTNFSPSGDRVYAQYNRTDACQVPLTGIHLVSFAVIAYRAHQIPAVGFGGCVNMCL